MDLPSIGYILLIIPGFLLVWTYRYFTKSPKIGEFEYAAWSFVWGIVLLFIVSFLIINGRQSPSIPNNIASLIGGVLGMSIGMSIALAIPLGFFGSIISRLGLFCWINNILFKFLEKITNLK